MSNWQDNCSDVDDDELYRKVEFKGKSGLYYQYHPNYCVHKELKP
jgi:hypothetical protein